jgi:Aspartyl/Asparaginyl beta-hydroxylase
MHLELLRTRAFDTVPVCQELRESMWNTITHRTEKGPHREADDIWVRYNAYSNYEKSPEHFNDEHESVWYPVADELPSAKAIAETLALQLNSQLGAVLMTRIRPGAQVYPHIDQGWHASYYEKFCVCVKANPDQSFNFQGEELRTRDGDLFWFDNAYSHWVKNESQEARISMIICLRRPPCRGALPQQP